MIGGARPLLPEMLLYLRLSTLSTILYNGAFKFRETVLDMLIL